MLRFLVKKLRYSSMVLAIHTSGVFYCCGTSEASEQQHNQKNIGYEKSRFDRFLPQFTAPRTHLEPEFTAPRTIASLSFKPRFVAWYFPSRVDFDGARLKRWASDVFLLFTSCLTTYFHSRILLKIVNGFVNLEYFKLVSVWHYSPLFCRKFRPLTTLFTRWVFHCFTIDVLWIRLKTDLKAEKAQATFHLNG